MQEANELTDEQLAETHEHYKNDIQAIEVEEMRDKKMEQKHVIHNN